MSDPHLLSWSDYWSLRTCWTFPELFRVNAAIFAKFGMPWLQLGTSDRVLDIGCGPGFLDGLIAPHVARIDCLDVSEPFIRHCQRINGSCPNLRAKVIDPTAGDLNVFHTSYDAFLCISVVQYLPDLQSVKAMLRSVRSMANPGAKLFLADLPVQRSGIESLADAVRALRLALRRGYARTLASSLLKNWLRFLEHRALTRRLPHFCFSRETLETLCEEMDCEIEWVPEDLSIAPNRLNAVMRFFT